MLLEILRSSNVSCCCSGWWAAARGVTSYLESDLHDGRQKQRELLSVWGISGWCSVGKMWEIGGYVWQRAALKSEDDRADDEGEVQPTSLSGCVCLAGGGSRWERWGSNVARATCGSACWGSAAKHLQRQRFALCACILTMSSTCGDIPSNSILFEFIS